MKINISHKDGQEMVITNADTGEVLDVGYICWEKAKGEDAMVVMGVVVNEVNIERTDVTAEPRIGAVITEQGLIHTK